MAKQARTLENVFLGGGGGGGPPFAPGGGASIPAHYLLILLCQSETRILMDSEVMCNLKNVN